MPPEIKAVIACRQRWGQEIVSGAQIRNCEACKIEVHVSASGIEKQAQGGMIVCQSCALMFIKVAEQQNRFGGVELGPDCDKADTTNLTPESQALLNLAMRQKKC